MSASIIAIDAMGGDFGPHCIVPACTAALAEYPSLKLVLVGQSSILEPILAPLALSREASSRLSVRQASETIEADERPSAVLRGKPDASMRIALEMVRDGEAQACISAGNTGALMALSRQVLKTLPGVDRPAMMTWLPTQGGRCYLLDLGANLECTAEHLYQFAVMGSVAAEARGIPRPRVALLNVGHEATKGNAQVRQAAELLQASVAVNFIGYIEGDGFYRGEADVVVCDGFVGNVLLKASEGLATMIAQRVNARFRSGLWSRLVGLLALPLLRKLRQDLEPEQHNGASFVGLQGIVVKSHGAAGASGFQSAIRCAAMEIRENLPQRLHGRLEQVL